MMVCCASSDITREVTQLHKGIFSFRVTLTYCKSCGKVKPLNTSIEDGKKSNWDFDNMTPEEIIRDAIETEERYFELLKSLDKGSEKP